LAEVPKLVVAAWTSISFIGPRFLFSNSKNVEQEKEMSQKSEFLHNWISNLMKNMEQHLDEKRRIDLLEECGRNCAKRHAQKEASKQKGNLEGWIGTMKKWVGSDNVQREKSSVRVIYNKCFCPLVQDASPLMSKTYCNCSRGWLKEVFETVMEKPVEVRMEDSIMMGGKQCRFTISL
jgi:predicted hydrocarbon binding protein